MIYLTIFGTAVTVASLIYAVKTNDEKKKREAQVKETLIGLAGDIERIQTNPLWADVHFTKIRDIALENNDTNTIKNILKHAHDGARDAAAAERMLGNLLINQDNKLQPMGINLKKHAEEKKEANA